MKRLLPLGVLLTLSIPGSAQAHTEDDLTNWLYDWEGEVEARGALSPLLMDEYIDMLERHPCSKALDTACEGQPLSVAAHNDLPSGSRLTAEDWRSVVEIYFGPNTNAALRVMRCESGGDADAVNPSSRASGLFQFLPSTWTRVTGEAYPGGVFDGNDNIAAAAKLSNGGTNWREWECKP